MDEEHFQRIKNRLKETNFRSGFACLFYGAPGTGKTETVLQIAKKTGRDLIQVNVSEVKSMWVGESEKNIKGIFDDYKKKVKQLAKAPILLFNEADAIIGKRQLEYRKSTGMQLRDSAILTLFLGTEVSPAWAVHLPPRQSPAAVP